MNRVLPCWISALALLLAAPAVSPVAAAQSQQPLPSPGSPPPAATAQDVSPAPEDGQTQTVFPHSESSPFWISGQANVILQWHPDFHSPYEGPHSLRAAGENAISRVFTLYLGARLTDYAEVLFDFESAGGRGISDAFGLAGFTNLDVVRNPSLGSTPYIARGMMHFVVPLSGERAAAERNPLSLFTSLPVRRMEIRFGRFQLADFFDVNSAGSDSHLQFLNWTADNNGGYDYAADTRGYTIGALLDYEDRSWGLRFAETLMPRVANGIDFQWNIERARAENIELELRPAVIPRRRTALRLLAYVNHANMGDYRVAIEQFQNGQTPVPDVTNHPLQEKVKYGFGVNAQQEITPWLTGFARFGWNEGRHESFAYTEVNQTVSVGAVAGGRRWRRKYDRAGAAFMSNALSGDHRLYLQYGGEGFLLGDSTLNYGREKIIEGVYTVHLWRGVYFSLDAQHINNPGYNRDRGPVTVPSARLHLEF